MLQTVLNFGGFYGSAHEARLEDIIEICTTDDHGDAMEDPPEVDWRGMTRKYCKSYVDFCNEELGTKIVFDRIDSPREYNFHTDKLLVEINKEDVAKIQQFIIDNDLITHLESHIAYYTKSHPGFIPHYGYDYFISETDLLTEACLDVIINEYLDNRDEDFSKWDTYYDKQGVRDSMWF